MADALAALGLVANILQFVELGAKIVSTALEFYKSRGGVIISNKYYVTLSYELESTLGDIQAHHSSRLRPQLSELIMLCKILNDDLVATLNGQKIDPKKNHVLESVKKSISYRREAEKVKSLEERITKIRDHVCSILSLGFMHDIFRSVTTVQTSNERLLDSVTKVESGNESLLDSVTAFQTTNETLLKTMAKDISRWANSYQDETKERAALARSLPSLVQEVNNLHQRMVKQKSITRVLKSLHFAQIKERISDVHEAHQGTFDWIFNKRSNFSLLEWLESNENNGLYWVSGHAGSGKSTLMKFIVNHPATSESLRQWAGSQSLIIASHFFWSNGTTIQKSQEGLFRTLLFQILVKIDDLIPILCPDRWELNGLASLEPWTLRELFNVFKTLASIDAATYGVRPFRICVFIDGLDEYGSDHRELVSMLQDLSLELGLKICASSRPWVEFRDAFSMSKWNIALHELTSGDIEKYVHDQLPLQHTHGWVEPHDTDTLAALASEVCKMAQGVFLWVYLVVRSLRVGLSNGDNINDLQKRLKELPSDLEGYFQLMLDGIDTVYRQRTTRLFKCLLYSESDLPVIIFHLFDLEESDANYFVEDWIELLTEAQIRGLSRSKQYQITAQCKDLIRISDDKGEVEMFRYRAGFLHRTVSDFFRTQVMDEILGHRVGPDFDPRLTLSRAYLSMLKFMPRYWVTKRIIPFQRILRLMLGILSHVQDLEIIHSRSQSVLLDELHDTMNSLVGNSDWVSLAPELECASIRDITARCGLPHYMEYLASPQAGLSDREKARLLRQARRSKLNITLGGTFTISNSETIDTTSLDILLRHGFSPNLPSHSHPNTTVWIDFVEPLSSRLMPGTYDACKLMISYGADRYIRDQNGDYQDVTAHLKKVFPAHQYEELISLYIPDYHEPDIEGERGSESVPKRSWFERFTRYLGSP